MKNYQMPLERLYQWEKSLPQQLFLRQPIDGKWQEFSWGKAGDEVRRVAAGLQGMGLPKGSSIAIFSKNCAHWIMADLAIWMSGHTSVPIYPTLHCTDIRFILEHSQAKAIFIGKLDHWEVLPEVPPSLHRIYFPYREEKDGQTWKNWVATQAPLKESPQRDPGEKATVIYTSGSTGNPKGVVHTFQSLAAAGTEGTGLFECSPRDVFFSYLPLAHVAERLFNEMFALYCGGSISFAESLDLFSENLRETQPTRFLAVPRIWAKFQMGILEKLPQKKLDVILKVPLVSGLVKKKLKNALGLTRAETIISGSAPIPASLLEWFSKLGIIIQEAYAMTENFAYSHITRRDHVKVGTVGQPGPNVKVQVTSDGELLISSPSNMEGYLFDPELTQATFAGEFIRTGDRGEVDSEGFLKITGRTKDLFKTAKGKYVAPVALEDKMAPFPYLEQICVVGSGLVQPIALATLSDAGKKADRKKIEEELGDLLQKVNATLLPHEHIGTIVLTNEAWTQEDGLLTPTLKIKRHAIEKKYGSQFESWGKSRGIVFSG